MNGHWLTQSEEELIPESMIPPIGGGVPTSAFYGPVLTACPCRVLNPLAETDSDEDAIMVEEATTAQLNGLGCQNTTATMVMTANSAAMRQIAARDEALRNMVVDHVHREPVDPLYNRDNEEAVSAARKILPGSAVPPVPPERPLLPASSRSGL